MSASNGKNTRNPKKESKTPKNAKKHQKNTNNHKKHMTVAGITEIADGAPSNNIADLMWDDGLAAKKEARGSAASLSPAQKPFRGSTIHGGGQHNTKFFSSNFGTKQVCWSPPRPIVRS